MSAGQPGAPGQADPKAPLFAGKYRLVRMLGKGAMGEVWLADEEGPRNFSRRVAVKRLLSATDLNEYATESFIAEAQVIARLDHPNIVRLIELGSAEGALYLVLDFVDGPALDKLIRKSGAFSPYAVAYMGREVARALEAVHSMCDDAGNNYGVVHRDVTPSNILLSRDGRVRLTDFGVARISGLGGDKTEAGVFKGKLPYMPPEQARGESFDGRADIFALGITLFEALLGRRLRRAETQSQLIMMVASEPVPRVQQIYPEAQAGLAAVIDRANAFNANQRFVHAGELAAALDEVLHSFGPGAERAAREEIKNRVASFVGIAPPNSTGTYPSTSSAQSSPSGSTAGEWSVPLSSPSSPSSPSSHGSHPSHGSSPSGQYAYPSASSASNPPSASSHSGAWPGSGSGRYEGPTHFASGTGSTGSHAASIQASPPPERTRLSVILAIAGALGMLAGGIAFVILRAARPPDASSSPAPSAVAIETASSASATAPAPTETSSAEAVAAPSAEPSASAAPLAHNPPHNKASAATGTRPTRNSPTQTTAAAEEATGPGTLRVVVLPWADVSVDGRSVGTTPIAPLSLPAGPHSVSLRNSELGVSRSVGVTVKPGESTLLRIDLKRAD